MRRLAPLALLAAVLAVPTAAEAAKVKISPRAATVSDAGVANVEVANPNRYVLRGTAKVLAAGRTVASRKVKLPKRAVTTVKLRFGADAIAALRDASGRATMKLKLRRADGRKASAKRGLTLRLPAAGGGGPQPPAPPAPGPAPGGNPPPAPAGNHWAGRMGTEEGGAHDDFEFDVSNGQMQITRAPAVPVSCFESPGYRSALSFELFTAPGPWTIGTDGLVAQQGIAVNQLVSSGSRTINYKVTETSQQADRITGKLGMSFSDSRYDIFTNTIYFINCAGTQSFEAIPAG